MITLIDINVILESLIITGLIGLGFILQNKKDGHDEQDKLDKLYGGTK